jgi:hypothetical protein
VYPRPSEARAFLLPFTDRQIEAFPAGRTRSVLRSSLVGIYSMNFATKMSLYILGGFIPVGGPRARGGCSHVVVAGLV